MALNEKLSMNGSHKRQNTTKIQPKHTASSQSPTFLISAEVQIYLHCQNLKLNFQISIASNNECNVPKSYLSHSREPFNVLSFPIGVVCVCSKVARLENIHEISK